MLSTGHSNNFEFKLKTLMNITKKANIRIPANIRMKSNSIKIIFVKSNDQTANT